MLQMQHASQGLCTLPCRSPQLQQFSGSLLPNAENVFAIGCTLLPFNTHTHRHKHYSFPQMQSPGAPPRPMPVCPGLLSYGWSVCVPHRAYNGYTCQCYLSCCPTLEQAKAPHTCVITASRSGVVCTLLHCHSRLAHMDSLCGSPFVDWQSSCKPARNAPSSIHQVTVLGLQE